METLKNYSDLIKLIPVFNQSAVIKKDVWDRISYDVEIRNSIFGADEKIEISRADVHAEINSAKKIVMILMWGYPTGGRGSNIQKIINKGDKLSTILRSIDGKNLTRDEANAVISEFSTIQGLGISTWSKLLHFFNVSIESNRCQIFDLKVVDSLNKKQFIELGTHEWKQDINHYYRYIDLVNVLAAGMEVLPEQVELFMFYYNLYYKF